MSTLFGQLTQLQQFDLGTNACSGQVPSSFAKLTALRVLGLGTNKLSGEIDSQFSHLTSIQKFALHNNDFNGREEQKPTKFLTNRPAWEPRGRTGNGRCCAGRCTGELTKSGKT